MPDAIIVSPLKVDLLIISRKLKKVIFCELTCPNEENLLSWRKKKEAKYKPILSKLNNRWQGILFTIEVSVKGFVVSDSFYRFCNSLGLYPKEIKSLRYEPSRHSLRCSYIIWLNRRNKHMDKNHITPLTIKKTRIYKKSRLYQIEPPQTFTDPAQQLLNLHNLPRVPIPRKETPTSFYASFLLSLSDIINETNL